MTRAEIRRQKERVERAVAWIQQRLGTSYEILVAANGDVSGMTIGRSARGRADLNCFYLEFNAEWTASQPRAEIRASAFHEVMHCIAWNAWEPVLDGRPRREWEKLKDSMENAFHEIERRVAPWIIG